MRKSNIVIQLKRKKGEGEEDREEEEREAKQTAFRTKQVLTSLSPYTESSSGSSSPAFAKYKSPNLLLSAGPRTDQQCFGVQATRTPRPQTAWAKSRPCRSLAL